MNNRADEVNLPRQDGAQSSGAGDDLPTLVLSLANELLERTDVALDEDFFTAGGDSVLAMHLVGHLARRTGVGLRVSLLFSHPVLREFTEQVDQRRSEAAAAAPAAPAGALAAALDARRSTGAM
ncbi:acyl carrier protein [Streptomyces sp. NPDC093097]|uniref:acyl carrier protein n=1 Tax=Streptomyces sp. NPDC093097 TaxID=3366027 RepID=UPI0038191D81